jgi:hypothetical protein
MKIRVELYGVARHLAGVGVVDLTVGEHDESVSLGRVLCELAKACPPLLGDCIADGKLGDSFVANLDGERFVRDAATIVRPGQHLMVLSADAGG